MKTLSGLVVLLVCGAAQASAQGAAVTEPPVVVVQGEGVVRVAPDQAFVRIGAESRSKNPREAQSQNAEAMTAVQQKIAAAGVQKEAVRTVSVTLQQEFDYANGRQSPRGYVARNVIEVRVDDLTKLGEITDASVTSGATSVQGLRFDVKGRDAREREALRLAVAEAMARADAAASGAKRTVDRVIRIQEAGAQIGPPTPVMRDSMALAMGGAPPPTTPMAEGEIEIRAQVTVTVSIK